jgi:hypothetical protein
VRNKSEIRELDEMIDRAISCIPCANAVTVGVILTAITGITVGIAIGFLVFG